MVLDHSFRPNGKMTIDKTFICQDTAIFHLTEKDALADERNSFKIGCRYTGDFTLTPWIDIELESKTCYKGTATVAYRVHYEVHEIDQDSFAQLRYIYNVNSPAEFTIDGKQDSIFGGDEFNLMAQFDDIEFTFNIPFEEKYSYI